MGRVTLLWGGYEWPLNILVVERCSLAAVAIVVAADEDDSG
jgi:hypothetical protein